MVQPLDIGEYRNAYEPGKVECASTGEIRPMEEIIGQERALRALRFGLEIREKGFNVYTSGAQGTGRMRAVRSFLDELAKAKARASDWVYVHNFENQYEPNAIALPAGRGPRFREDMKRFIEEARQALPRAFESEEYAKRRDETLQSLQGNRTDLIARINQRAQEAGFVIQMSPIGLLTIPVINGRPVPEEEFVTLPDDVRAEVQRRRDALNAELRSTLRQVQDIERQGAEAVKGVNHDIALYAIGNLVAELKENYADVPEIPVYVDAVQNDILDNLQAFLGVPEQPGAPPQFQAFIRELPFRKYDVNVVVDNADAGGAPVIVEQNPTFQNLLGKIEKEVQFGIFTTDFTMIRPGSLHKANGGYLILSVEDLLRTPLSWDGLKTALKTGEAVIEEPGERMGFITAKTIKPEPVPLDIKVALIGTPMIYQILYRMDPDFKELFKVKADFDVVMDRNDENAGKYADFMCNLVREENLRHLDREAIARVIEYGSRLAADKEKLSTRFAAVADLIREANFYAASDGAEQIGRQHVMKTIDEKVYRSNLIQEKIQEYIQREIFLIETEGEKVGQVNGLSVIGLGDFAFGRPSKVTASIGVGREGIMDIEREAALGGPIHTKGVLIISGYLNNNYARDKPLGLSARLVFEQSYEGIDGDSASSTELYALLSALSGLPLKQYLAVTGSVNQKGEVQAIGGVNEKLEGFFEVCKAKGLNGDQGALIPASNVQNLMLKEEILEAAKAGKFRIYPVRTIDEGIEVLTGVPAGSRREDGTYEEGTVNYLVDRRLREMAETLKGFQPMTAK
ncbi:MAG: Peptidase S16, lon domain-containing protein [Methanoculleus marisnigri]|uniref:Peptidase S16, lon domain-containing protein n=1 Tax=Methanoculleus marisnigri TaxID=2198 RepID=A0A101IUL1_9EURY|nr:MAG: Peptidase S16, lon domain-containing protein [Methanoculleus marisnigri]